MNGAIDKDQSFFVGDAAGAERSKLRVRGVWSGGAAGYLVSERLELWSPLEVEHEEQEEATRGAPGITTRNKKLLGTNGSLKLPEGSPEGIMF